MFLISVPDGGYVLHSMCGAKLDFVITHKDRENDFAIASRKIALEKMQKAANRRKLMDRVLDTDVVSVGRNVCVLNYCGYDVVLHQRDIKENTLTNMETSAMTLNGKAGILTVTEIFAPRQNAPLTLLTQIFRTAHR